MKRSLTLLLFILALGAVGTTQTGSPTSANPLRAPTYYIAIRARNCERESIRFDGASNLPLGTLIALKVSEPFEDALKDYTDDLYVPVGPKGLFEGKIAPREGTRFHRSLLLIANFTTYVPKQPQSVLQVVGKIGENLGGLGNPQVHYLSGNYQVLQAIDIAPWCGEGITEPAH
jgi:hypothetical protein